MSAFELRTTLPCDHAIWRAATAEEWWQLAKHERPISFLPILKAYMTVEATQLPPLDALSRLIVFHGLMSIQWDMKHKDHTTLGKPKT
jgi:hypothetical protein